MKTTLSMLLILGLFYCIPQGKGYLCNPVDFEIKEFSSDIHCPDKDSSTCYGTTTKHKCLPKDGKIVCTPFDKGTVLMEPAHECPKPATILPSPGISW